MYREAAAYDDYGAGRPVAYAPPEPLEPLEPLARAELDPKESWLQAHEQAQPPPPQPSSSPTTPHSLDNNYLHSSHSRQGAAAAPAAHRTSSTYRALFLTYLALSSGAVLGVGVWAQLDRSDALVNELAWNALYRAFLADGIAFIVLGGVSLLAVLARLFFARILRRQKWSVLALWLFNLLMLTVLALLAALCLVYAAGNVGAARQAWVNAGESVQCAAQEAFFCAGFSDSDGSGAGSATAPASCTAADTDRGGCYRAFIEPQVQLYAALQGTVCLNTAVLLLLELSVPCCA